MGKAILIVDDDADDRELVAEALLEIDKTIRCAYAKHGYEAIDLLSQPNTILPDFIFLDLNMPRINGKQVLALIKQSNRLKTVPVIIFTTSKLDSDVNEVRSLGASLFLTKPSRFSELVETLRAIVNNEWSLIKTPS